MRKQAIRIALPPGTDVDGLLKGMVEKGWLKANPAGTWYYLTVDGADRVKAA
jgi:DNA-binding IclR family transcriptional regulator